MRYYEVSPTTIVRADAGSFSYASHEELVPGIIVTIPVGKKVVIGVVLQKISQPPYDTREIIAVINQPPLPNQLLSLHAWMSQFYATHPATVWQTILPRGVTKKRRKSIELTSVDMQNRTKNVFTKDQLQALQIIDSMTSGTALLHGVTGSGKTLVYIEASRRAAAEGKSSIILIPEIALTTQLVSAFTEHLDNVIVTHSRQTEAERHATWLHVLTTDKPVIIIGPRSALFMPIHNLGFIAIDECHEPSFKQEQSPRYSALRTAAVLAQHHNAKLVLGSATPGIADYYLSEQRHRPIISMSKPARKDAVKPTIKVVDMTKRNNFTQHFFLSDTLLSQLQRTFNDGQQALIFHNRRGTTAITLCQNCGWQAGCPNCFVPLTLHQDKHQLVCHICGYNATVPTVCPECQHADIIHKGIGTKRIETELSKLFPQQTIARFDADTPSDQTVEKLYQDVKEGAIDLIIGTQMIAKGLDLPHLRTVGVVQADTGLTLPDFAAAERTFQLLAQVVGRVGRSHHPTTVVVQTYQPQHPAIQDGLTQNYADFYHRTIAQRQATMFPPFTHLLKLTCIYKTEAAAIRNAQKLASTLKSVAPRTVQILGPTPAFYERVRDTYRWQLLLKSPQRDDLVALLAHLPPQHWQFELDPISLL